MYKQKIVTQAQWLESRKEFLIKEKEFTRLRDQLSEKRRQLPWVKIDKNYAFISLKGEQSLSDLFEGRSQLIVYHFMYGKDWDEGCPSCSFWADNYNDIIIHLNHRDASFVTISHAPLDKLTQYRKRMGWNFNWVSSNTSDFNFDFHVSFTAKELDNHAVIYNYQETNFPDSEAAGISIFVKDKDDTIYHTYSCFSRGLDMLNGAYHYMDLLPKGRDESNLEWTMEWLKRHDQYSD